MKPIVRIPLAVLVTSAVISLGLIGVHASEQCVRFITKKRHHTAATLAAWAAWDKAHPNWHPKPVHEAIASLDFACSIPLIQKPLDGELPPLNLTGFDVPLDMLPPPAPPTLVAENTPPPVIFPDTPALPMVSPPIYSPEYPQMFGGFPPPHTSVSVTPEPSSWMLLATSMLAMWGLARRRLTLRRATVRR